MELHEVAIEKFGYDQQSVKLGQISKQHLQLLHRSSITKALSVFEKWSQTQKVNLNLPMFNRT